MSYYCNRCNRKLSSQFETCYCTQKNNPKIGVQNVCSQCHTSYYGTFHNCIRTQRCNKCGTSYTGYHFCNKK